MSKSWFRRENPQDKVTNMELKNEKGVTCPTDETYRSSVDYEWDTPEVCSSAKKSVVDEYYDAKIGAILGLANEYKEQMPYILEKRKRLSLILGEKPEPEPATRQILKPLMIFYSGWFISPYSNYTAINRYEAAGKNILPNTKFERVENDKNPQKPGIAIVVGLLGSYKVKGIRSRHEGAYVTQGQDGIIDNVHYPPSYYDDGSVQQQMEQEFWKTLKWANSSEFVKTRNKLSSEINVDKDWTEHFDDVENYNQFMRQWVKGGRRRKSRRNKKSKSKSKSKAKKRKTRAKH